MTPTNDRLTTLLFGSVPIITIIATVVLAIYHLSLPPEAWALATGCAGLLFHPPGSTRLALQQGAAKNEADAVSSDKEKTT